MFKYGVHIILNSQDTGGLIYTKQPTNSSGIVHDIKLSNWEKYFSTAVVL